MKKLPVVDMNQFSQHFSTQISKEMVDFVENVVLKWSRYIFTYRVGKKQYGYCTHCKSDFQTGCFKHGSRVNCPVCESACKVRASGRGRKTMIDDAYFVFYEKSAINPEAITARGIYVVRDYRFDFRKTETEFATKAMYLFEPGNSMAYHRYLYYSETKGMCYVGNWDRTKTVRSENNSSMANKASYCSYDSIKKTVKGTPFQYSTWETYKDGDMVQFFDLFSKYPCIEYLTKLGFSELVSAKLHGHHTYSAVNWNGKSPLQVLRVSKQELHELKSSGIKIGPLALKLFQISRKDKSNLSFREIYEIVQTYGSHLKDLQKILKFTTLRRVHNYIQKQHTKKYGNRKYGNMAYQVLHTWRDYLADCIDLEMDVTQDNILFPSDLDKAHQDTLVKIKHLENQMLDMKIQRRMSVLHKYCFEAFGLIIRPALSTKELIQEGNALSHCVGRYAKDYASGKTNILVIRKAEALDKPFYTMEVRGNKIMQTQGFKNRRPDETVAKFIAAFEEEKLSGNKSKTEERKDVVA